MCIRDRVVAVELDRALMPVLAETLADYDNFEVVHGDVLETDLAALCKEKFGDGKADVYKRQELGYAEPGERIFVDTSSR